MVGTSNTSWLYGENKIQRPITINGAVNTALPVIRASVLKKRELNPQSIFGSGNLGVPGGTPNSLLNIKRYRPVFHHKDAGRTTGYEEYAAATTAVFQALNGVPVEPRFGVGRNFNKEAFRRQWRCPGLSMTDYNFDLPEQTPSGVAVMISGAADTFNNGPETWHVGDRIVFTSPELDPAAQAAEREFVSRNPGEHRERIEFILRPVQHVEATLWFEEAFTRFFAAGHDPRLSSVDVLLNEVAEGDDGANRAAVGFYAFLKQVILATCVSLAIAGVNPNLNGVNWDGRVLPAASRGAYTGVQTALDNDMGRRIYGGADPADTQAALVEASRVSRGWMHLLGLVPARAAVAGQLASSQGFIDQVIHLSCPGGILLKDNFDYFNWSRLIPDVEAGSVYEPTRSFLGGPSRPNTNDVWGAQLYLSRTAFRTTLRGMKDSILDQVNSYVGTANEITPHGSKGNIRR